MKDFSGGESLCVGGFRTVRAFLADPNNNPPKLNPLNFAFEYGPIGTVEIANCHTQRWMSDELGYDVGTSKFPTEGLKSPYFIIIAANSSTYMEYRDILDRAFVDRLQAVPRGHYRLVAAQWDLGTSGVGVGKFIRSEWASDLIHPNDWESFQTKYFRKHVEKFPPPYENCTCGFYSFYDIPTDDNYVNRYAANVVWGVVENSGSVIHGTRGIRSQKMKVLEVGRFDNLHKLIQKYPLSKYDTGE